MNNNELKVFNNENFGQVRMVEFNEKPYFVANDVAKALGYSDCPKAIRTHCKGVAEMSLPSKGGNQAMKIIPEGDIYRLIIKSKLPTAEKFETWVMDEVLPSIRKTGQYVKPIQNPQMEGLQQGFEFMKQMMTGMEMVIKSTQEFVKDSINVKDEQIDTAMELIGIRDRNTKMLTSTLKEKLSDLYGKKILATNHLYIKYKNKVFKEFHVFSWEQIPIGKFNSVYAYIDSIDEVA